MIKLEDFESTYGDYGNCPLEKCLLVWTGDGFDVECVITGSECGTYFPANGVHLTHYTELPLDNKTTQDFFEDDVKTIKGEDKRFHILSDAEFGWSNVFVEGFDTFEEAESRRKELVNICDPYEVLVVRDTHKV